MGSYDIFQRIAETPHGKKIFKIFKLNIKTFKTIKNYSNYSPMLNCMWCRRRAYLKQTFLLNFIKNIFKKICRLRNLFLTHILSSDIVRKWIPSHKIFYLYQDSNLCRSYLITYEPRRYLGVRQLYYIFYM